MATGATGHEASSKGKVLLTGGTGFIACHILDCLVQHGFDVVTTVRSEEKGQRLLQSLGPRSKHVDFVVVEDVSCDGAFDTAVRSNFDYVVHTASPYHLNVQDVVKDFLDPAVKGTTGLLASVAAHAPSVRRVVLTSSSAAMLNPANHAAVYDESHWAPISWSEAVNPSPGQTQDFAYRASKVLAERAAWQFMSEQKPGFDLATINNTYTFGPVPPHVTALNTSNARIRDMVAGRMRSGLAPTAPVFTFVDVRDVALAHVRAAVTPHAGGKRFYIVGGYFSNKRIADEIRRAFPDMRMKLPPSEGEVDDFPENVYGFDNKRSRDILGMEYRGLEESVRDTAASLVGRQELLA